MPQVGKYQLVRKLAVGGMAEVFLAKAAGPMGFEKTLVLKRILPHLASDPHFVEMFLSEAKLAAQLNHPNLVQIFDFGETGGAYYIAMEFIDGPNLRALYRRAFEIGMPLAFGLVAKVISFGCEGLAYAHEFADPETGVPLGLIHRDISPDNLLLGRNGAVKVVDFGIAKAAGQEHHTKTGTLKGKLSYMPPEQLKGVPLDRRADVFALGVVLYELCTGGKPFEATTEVAIMQAILYEPFIPAASRRAGVPVAMQAILDKALAKDRDQRYSSCRELQADLERFILSSGEPVGQFQLANLVATLAAAPVPAGGVPLAGTPTTPPRSPSHPSLPAVQPPAPPPKTSASLLIEVSEADVVRSSATSPSEPAGANEQPSTAVIPSPFAPSVGAAGVEGRMGPGAGPPGAFGPYPAPPPGSGSYPGAAVPGPYGPYAAAASGSGSHPMAPMPGNGFPPGPMTSFEAIEREADQVVPLTARRPSREVPVVQPGASRGPLYFGVLGVLLLLGAGGFLVLRSRGVEPFASPRPAVASPVAVPPLVAVAPPEAKPPEVKPPVEVRPAYPKPPENPEPPAVAKADLPRKGKHPKNQPVVAAPKEQPKPLIVALQQPDPPKPADPPPVAPALASFQIETSPPLQIRVNGKFVGSAQATVSNLPPGDVRVEVYDSGLGIAKGETFTLSAGANGIKRIVVGQGSLEFRVRPFATVYLDGKPLGQTPIPALQVYEGKHSVRLVNKELGKEHSTDFVVKAGQPNMFKYIFPE